MVDITGDITQLGAADQARLCAEVQLGRDMRMQSRGKPVLASFNGNESNNSSTYQLWLHSIKGLMADGGYHESIIREAVRRSLAGQAAQVLINLDYDVCLDDILDALDLVYGDVSDRTATWQEFYNARQGRNEQLVEWFNRLQSILRKASMNETKSKVEKDEMLKTHLWMYLSDSRLRDASRHIYDDKDIPVNTLFSYLRRQSETAGLSDGKRAQTMVMTNIETPQNDILTRLGELEKLFKQSLMVRNNGGEVSASTFRCWECDKTGHRRAECPRRRELHHDTQSRDRNYPRYQRQHDIPYQPLHETRYQPRYNAQYQPNYDTQYRPRNTPQDQPRQATSYFPPNHTLYNDVRYESSYARPHSQTNAARGEPARYYVANRQQAMNEGATAYNAEERWYMEQGN